MLLEILPFKPAFALLIGLSAFCFGTAIAQLNSMLPAEDRDFMDPLPPTLRFAWPLIRVVAEFGCSLLPYELLERTEVKLQRTGVGYLLTAEQFWAVRFLGAFAGALLGFILAAATGVNMRLSIFILAILGFLLPNVWLSDTRKRREKGIRSALPQYLDFITMAVEAGLNLQGAIGNAVEKSPAGPLRMELSIVLRDIRSGVIRADALRRMAERVDVGEVTSLVNSLIQAERMGSSLGQVLRVQAEQRREERFQRAEKLAMEAPVKLIFPLILFIFPLTFMVVGFPIAMKIMSGGLF
ncbi:MAG: type II secretion system F family protein [Pseudomonadota bacterium]